MDTTHFAKYEQGTGDDKISVNVTFDLENKDYKIKDLEGLDLRIENYEQTKFTNLITLLTAIKADGDTKFA
ncbi:hypothetical protein V9L05_15310 [Bernardetia sp. Wsw4-3y2]|uniref:hypothetical protein n=1 Tax=Bernardetia sp. Wsw4-3y2 TaxID=3127471 RepID=UPI0030CCF3AA